MFTSISCFQWFVTVIFLCIQSWNIINSFNIATFKTQNNKHVFLCYALLYFTNSHFNWLYPFFEVFLIFEKVLKLNCSIFFFKEMGVLSLGKRVRGYIFFLIKAVCQDLIYHRYRFHKVPCYLIDLLYATQHTCIH